MTKAEMFVNELIDYIFAYPDDDWVSMEVLCRKLYKHDLITKKDGEWIGEYLEHYEPKTEDPPMDEYYKDHDEFYELQTDCAWKGEE